MCDDDGQDWAAQELLERRRFEQEKSMQFQVYRAINAVTEAMSKIGISKDGRNSQQGYAFRGIDQVYGALSPLLAKHGLCILPRVIERVVSEQTSKNGGILFYTALKVEFDFVSAEDGSKHTVCTIGEAMDSGDKSSNKAMSAAYKYACFQAFCIPTEGDNDADSSTHEVVANKPDTKLVNKYASRITDAAEVDNKQAVGELMEEIREAGNEWRVAVWFALPKGVKDYIKEHFPKVA